MVSSILPFVIYLISWILHNNSMRKTFVLVRYLLVTGNKSSIQPKKTGRNGGWGDYCKVVAQSHRNLGKSEQSGPRTQEIKVVLGPVALYFHPLSQVPTWSGQTSFGSRIMCLEGNDAQLSGSKVRGRLPDRRVQAKPYPQIILVWHYYLHSSEKKTEAQKS